MTRLIALLYGFHRDPPDAADEDRAIARGVVRRWHAAATCVAWFALVLLLSVSFGTAAAQGGPSCDPQPPIPLYPQSPSEFFVADYEHRWSFEITFLTDEAGAVSGLVFEQPSEGVAGTLPRE